ncbi:probable trehalose-phosphate phosphatase H [Daucus carota subsp. sativus]|uniref:probable trehalose-phosphate phosphatase H n=1 Tax=Daucus carota subsp. sativus TaxID=79200 RepID=UPI003083974A
MAENQKTLGEKYCAKLEKAVTLKNWFKKKHQQDDVEFISKGRHDHKTSSHCSRDPHDTSHGDADYNSWLREHPSALSSFREIMNAARGKSIVVFLDYDGTLSPIVSDPDRAFMSNPMRSAVQEVSRHFPTAIISGRSRNKVYEFVKLKEVLYAGSHGMDIMGPPQQANTSYGGKYETRTLDENDQEFVTFQPAQEFLPQIEKMLKKLEKKTGEIDGVMIEDNRFCISVHYRHVKEQDYQKLEKLVERILKEYPKFHMTRGKKVLEIRPSIKWNKGHALEYLLETLGFTSSSDNDDAVPLYIGDDKTDEDAFNVLKSRGAGFPIIVTSKPRQTAASYSLRDPSEVLSFLIRMARWKSAHYC